MRARLAVALVAVLAAGLPLAAPVQASTVVAGYVLSRSTTGPALLQLELTAAPTPDAPRLFEGSFAGRVGKKGDVQQVASLGARVFGHGEDEPAVTRDGETQRICPTETSCVLFQTLAYSDVIYLEDKGGPEALNRFWIVTEGAFRIRLKGHGWTLARRPLSYRYQLARDSAAMQVDTGVSSVEISGDARLAGGRRGSLAVLMPPCSTSSTVPGAAAPLPRGVGSMSLLGGVGTPSVTCPSDVGTVYPTSHATGRTTWTSRGRIVGDHTFQSVRMFVVDL